MRALMQFSPSLGFSFRFRVLSPGLDNFVILLDDTLKDIIENNQL